MPINYCFKGKHMPYEMVQNPPWSNGRIKKLTFWPPPIRVLVRFSVKRVFQMLWLFDLPFKHVVFIFSLFGFETHVFAPFFFGSFFWRMNRGRTKYGINSMFGICHTVLSISQDNKFHCCMFGICHMVCTKVQDQEHDLRDIWAQKP